MLGLFFCLLNLLCVFGHLTGCLLLWLLTSTWLHLIIFHNEVILTDLLGLSLAHWLLRFSLVDKIRQIFLVVATL